MMPKTKYRIFMLSARAVMSFAKEQDGVYRFELDWNATERCKVAGAAHEQEGNALFYQLMCHRQRKYKEPDDEQVITELSDILFYMNFEGIFDRSNQVRQDKARDMFRPEGITLDFGNGPQRYVAFERSASMSRDSRLSFIRADYNEPVRRRVMLDMNIERCQLTKLYAYNGLMLSSGVRIDGINIHKPSRVIVVDNPTRVMRRVPVITARDDGTGGTTRKYYRHDTLEDVKVTCFDGVGLISEEYAETVDIAYCGEHIHTSFQIRMPYVKGMLHKVDFKDFLKRTGTQSIQDIWGKSHAVDDVDIILTESMFKASGWFQECGMSWKDYWKTFRKYDHALYIPIASREQPEALTTMNYQFVTTLSLQPKEFRPADLPDGWEHSPAEDSRSWLTKETELAYYNYSANAQYRLDHFLKHLPPDDSKRNKSRKQHLAEILQKNPLFIHEPIYQQELEARRKTILEGYATGELIVAGDIRFLSGDLLELMRHIASPRIFQTPSERSFLEAVERDVFSENCFFAPGAVYDHGDSCTLLRNPHIARNEEIQLSVYPEGDELRETYLGHLTDVVMVSSETLAAERLGGADYDGDMIRTITDPIVNRAVLRNYDYEHFESLQNGSNIPLLKIPSLSGPKKCTDDWQARFEAVRDTFSSRIGQICNAAFDRSIIAYDEGADREERRRCRHETELLAILTGLEIDSAKTGIRPDLDEYLKERRVKRSVFLQYKTLIENAKQRRAWYQPTHEERLKTFFEKTAWDDVRSPVERLPYLAWKLKCNTPVIKAKPATDEELFSFAVEKNWKDSLAVDTLEAVSELLKDYEACLARIRACKVLAKEKKRKSGIHRVLFSRGQEELYDIDELYALFQQEEPERITALRKAIAERQWQFMDKAEREQFLLEYLPESEMQDIYDLLTDFRCSGHLVLYFLVSDVDDENNDYDRKGLFRIGDSEAFADMMQAYAEKRFSVDYRAAVAAQCRERLKEIVKLNTAVRYVVAAGKRNLLFDLLLPYIEGNTRKMEVSDHVE